MAYDNYQSERIERWLDSKKVAFSQKKMMGGLCFLVDEKMLCGVLFDKKLSTDLLMVRIGEKAVQDLSRSKYALPMDFTGRPMKGYLFVKSEGLDEEAELDTWLQACLDFNPEAKSSKKK